MPLEEKIEELINKQSSFPFEMKVLNYINNSGYDTKHAGTYLDRHKNITREFDIRAEKNIKPGKYIKLAIECKCIEMSSPFIVHSVEASTEDQKHTILIEYKSLNDYLKKETSTYKDVSFLSNFSIPRPHKIELGYQLKSYEVKKRKINPNTTLYSCNKDLNFIGKSLDQVHKNGNGDGIKLNDSEMYNKISQAICSTYDLIDGCRESEENNQDINQHLVLPILVVPNNTLYNIIYKKNGEVKSKLKPVNNISYYIDKDFSKGFSPMFPVHNIPYLEIVTVDGLKLLIEKIENDPNESYQESFLHEDELLLATIDKD